MPKAITVLYRRIVRTLRKTYGDGFAPGTRSDARLDTVLKRAGVATLDQYLKQNRGK